MDRLAGPCDDAWEALDIPPVTTPAEARAALGRVIKGQGWLLEGLGEDDPVAARLVAARAKTKRVLASLSADPLTGNAGTMSPSDTVVGGARREVAENRQLMLREICRIDEADL